MSALQEKLDKSMSAGAPPQLTLDADLGIEHADALKQRLLSQLAANEPVLIDGAAVERLHSAALQLLCAFVRDRRSAGLEVRWGETSECLRDAAEILGLNQMLGMQSEDAAHPNSANTE